LIHFDLFDGSSNQAQYGETIFVLAAHGGFDVVSNAGGESSRAHG